MPYNSNIPQAADQLSISQADILNNFAALANIANNIAPFLLFPVQGSDPATSNTQMALYTKAVTGTPQLFLRKDTNGTVINLTSAGAAQNGWARLPSGFLVKWGTGLVATGAQLVAFPTGGTIPAFGTVFNAQLNIDSAAGAPAQPTIIYWNSNLTTGTNLAVNVKNSSSNAAATATFSFWAIGV